ncbi:protein ACCELERATED CELL DEATH 6 [Quercus suber]|uniref:protein ACCELERATED CELL DEATH 6 n=1 Tax=Quercus suber TaxID=58331 RepID=UPI0032DF8202
MARPQKLNAKLYKALQSEDTGTVEQLCEDVDERGLHILTIHEDTVLQVASYASKHDLVLRLLEELPNRHLDKLTRQNHVGNTILHEVAISNDSIDVAKKVLEKAPGLLCMRNHLGETALFRSVRYGKKIIFNFLAKKIADYDEPNQNIFLQRRDKTTILHMAILAQHFELALDIATKFGQLVAERDGDGMTGLQLLSCNPGAFQRDGEKGLLNSGWYNWTYYQEAMEKQKYQCAVKLANFLIESDTSWETTHPGVDQGKPTLHKYGGSSTVEKRVREETPMSFLGAEEGATKNPPPLFLATKSGCVEIVEQILSLYPQSVEHIDEKGRNILHIAIKYRQLKIFKHVTKMKLSLNRLVQKIDEDGNSILHTVGKKNKDYVPEKMQGPALELREELVWFERVKEITPSHFVDHRNNQKLTAEGLFDKTNKELRKKAMEWIKRTAEGCSLVAILIATVAFAAAYTIPGGSNGQTGAPVLLNQPFFVVFTVADVLSISFALTSVVLFLGITASPFRFVDFRHSLPNKLTYGLTLLFFSVLIMMIAFAATVLLMIHNGEGWRKVILYAVSFIPVGLFALSYYPLYRSLSKTETDRYLLKKAWQVISRSHCLSRETKGVTLTSNSPNPQHTMSV